jgi:hypothetical protein
MSKARTLGCVILVLSLPLSALLAGAGPASIEGQGSGPAVQVGSGGVGRDALFPAFKPVDPVVERGSPLFWAIVGGMVAFGLLALLMARWRPLHWLAGTADGVRAQAPR